MLRGPTGGDAFTFLPSGGDARPRLAPARRSAPRAVYGSNVYGSKTLDADEREGSG